MAATSQPDKFVVRYGAMRHLGVCTASGKRGFSRGMSVIVRTDRGLEAAKILAQATDKIVARLEPACRGQVLREMTGEDHLELARIHAQERDEFSICVSSIKKLGLQMSPVDVEHIFGGERIVVYYLAAGRIDFRELVKMLAGEFQTRIEMRQIGVRDEAKLMADYGDCGQPVCCNTHLVAMPPVSMKMAKMQKATLDPTKISGRCGRLKCCLRYEYETYEQTQADLPRIGSRVDTPEGNARVIGHNILAGQILIETSSRVRKLVAMADVSVLEETKPEEPPQKSEPS